MHYARKRMRFGELARYLGYPVCVYSHSLLEEDLTLARINKLASEHHL